VLIGERRPVEQCEGIWRIPSTRYPLCAARMNGGISAQAMPRLWMHLVVGSLMKCIIRWMSALRWREEGRRVIGVRQGGESSMCYDHDFLGEYTAINLSDRDPCCCARRGYHCQIEMRASLTTQPDDRCACYILWC
jgi:hypothetical protein